MQNSHPTNGRERRVSERLYPAQCLTQALSFDFTILQNIVEYTKVII